MPKRGRGRKDDEKYGTASSDFGGSTTGGGAGFVAGSGRLAKLAAAGRMNPKGTGAGKFIGAKNLQNAPSVVQRLQSATSNRGPGFGATIKPVRGSGSVLTGTNPTTPKKGSGFVRGGR